LEYKTKTLGYAAKVKDRISEKFGIKQQVFILDLNWDLCLEEAGMQKLAYREIPRFPAVQRDLAFVVDSVLAYRNVEDTVQQVKIPRLTQMKLFDVFESEKLGTGKKSMAVSFTFQDVEKTLTDKDIDEMMQKIIVTFEKELNAEIRKS
jgi:phenylalanyl-tRNA synthetase beta chain